VNPTVLAILNVWEEFKNMRLLDVDAILSKGNSYELRAFRSLTVQKFDKTIEKLLTR
jgi:dynein heavy chain